VRQAHRSPFERTWPVRPTELRGWSDVAAEVVRASLSGFGSLGAIHSFDEARRIFSPIVTVGTPEYNAVLQAYKRDQNLIWDNAVAGFLASALAQRKAAWIEQNRQAGNASPGPMPAEWNYGTFGEKTFEGKTLEELNGSGVDLSPLNAWLLANGFSDYAGMGSFRIDRYPAETQAAIEFLLPYLTAEQLEAYRWLVNYQAPVAPPYVPPPVTPWTPDQQRILVTLPDGRVVEWQGPLPRLANGDVDYVALGWMPTSDAPPAPIDGGTSGGAGVPGGAGGTEDESEPIAAGFSVSPTMLGLGLAALALLGSSHTTRRAGARRTTRRRA